MAKEGKYTFWVGRDLTKSVIKSQVAKQFGVHVIGIKTIATSGEIKRNQKGKKVTVQRNKKAVVILKDGEKINLFEEKK